MALKMNAKALREASRYVSVFSGTGSISLMTPLGLVTT